MTNQRQIIEIALDGTVFLETVTTEVINGQASSPTTERRSFAPGSDVSGQPMLVQQACQTAWTDEVLAAFARRRDAAFASITPVAP